VGPAIVSSALWSMSPTGWRRWLSSISCVHGCSHNSVWLLQPVVDDRMFLAERATAVAQHQVAHPECDCRFELKYAPSYTFAIA